MAKLTDSEGTESPESVNSEENNTGSPVLFNPAASDDAVPDMPAVQDHAVGAALERLEAQETTAPQAVSSSPAPVKGDTDIDGRPYDPAIHESPMRINRHGWIAKRPGGKSKASSASAAPRRSFVNTTPQGQPGAVPAAAASQGPDIAAQCRASAEMFAGTFIGVGQMVVGEEFKPEDKGEQDALVSSFNQYFIAKGNPDIPPGIALALGLGVYTFKRWNAPKFKEKRESLWMLAKRWYNDWRFRREEARKLAGG
jgi:hypothetical protein